MSPQAGTRGIAAAATMTLPPGHDLSYYKILAPLGAGAMGEVHRARDTRLGRDVAIQVLPAAEARAERAASIAAVAQSPSDRAGVVVAHPLAPGVSERIDALEDSIPAEELDGLLRDAEALTPGDVLALVFGA